jgi:peptidoglycan/xylan/chitin deacetylase (PgdA/CDA1 family)
MKKFSLRVLQVCGLFALARTMSASMARILMYHNFSGPGDTESDHVSMSEFRSQMKSVRQHFNVIPLSQLVEQLNLGVPLGRRTVALTIDDGRRNCYEFCFPVLKEFGIPATFFVVSSFIQGEDWIWTDKVLWLAAQPHSPNELAPSRIEILFATLNQMRPIARNACIKIIAAGMGIHIPKEPPLKYAPCSWSELREMADSELVEIGSHTVTHPILTSLTDQESWQELTVSRAQIEEGVGRQIGIFCFPNGKPQDYRDIHLRQVRDAGFTGAVVTRFGMVGEGMNCYDLPRIGISGRSDALSFSKYLDGVECYQEKLKTLGLRCMSA